MICKPETVNEHEGPILKTGAINLMKVSELEPETVNTQGRAQCLCRQLLTKRSQNLKQRLLLLIINTQGSPKA